MYRLRFRRRRNLPAGIKAIKREADRLAADRNIAASAPIKRAETNARFTRHEKLSSDLGLHAKDTESRAVPT
jgi:hypothetical protein